MLEAFAGLGEAVFRYLGARENNEQTKYADEMADLKEKVRAEKARGPDASQAKIEVCEERLTILGEAAKDALLARLAAKT